MDASREANPTMVLTALQSESQAMSNMSVVVEWTKITGIFGNLGVKLRRFAIIHT
jgi:hypothetical protein